MMCDRWSLLRRERVAMARDAARPAQTVALKPACLAALRATPLCVVLRVDERTPGCARVFSELT